MGLFSKIKAGIGIGGAKLEIGIDTPVIAPGDEIRGRIILRGGDLEQQCNGIELMLFQKWWTTEIHEGHEERTGHQEILDTIHIPDSVFTIAENSVHEFPFTIPLRADISPESEFELGASADIPGAIDPKASADVSVDFNAEPRGPGLTSVQGEREELPERPYDNDSGPDAVHLTADKKSCMLLFRDQVEFFDTTNGDYQHSWEAKDLLCACIAPDPDQVLTGNMDELIMVHDRLNGEILTQSEPLGDYIRMIQPLGADSRFVATNDSGLVAIFDHPSLEQIVILKDEDDEMNEARGLGVSPDGRRVFVSMMESTACYDAYSGEVLWEQYDMPASNGAHLDVSPDGRWVAVTLSGWGICWLDAANGEIGPVFEFIGPKDVHWPGMIGDATFWEAKPKFSPDGQRLAVNTPVGNLNIVDGSTAELIWEFERSKGMSWISDIAWLDNNRILLGHTHKRFTIWTLEPLQWEIDTVL